MKAAICMYCYVAFITSLIAARSKDAPRRQLPLVFGSFLCGLIWPISLWVHLVVDMPERHISQPGANQDLSGGRVES